MSNTISKDMLMRTAPSVLVNDPGMNPLVQVLAQTMADLFNKCYSPILYSRIDDLPEAVLDILAKDFKVEWYDYNWAIEAKRQTIKDSFYVHRHMGTVGAVKTALSDVWPPATVEEWFEYGGDPYYFRAILDGSNTDMPIIVDSALNAIMFYKSARSHLESNVPAVRVSFGIIIHTDQGSMKYHVRSCGTSPRVATHGNADDNGLTVSASAFESTYRARPCGTSLNSLA